MDQISKKVEKKNPMGTEKEFNILIKMSLPAIFSMLVQSIYNFVDSYYVSGLSEIAFRAVSLSFPIFLIMLAIGIGISIGVKSHISRKFGENNSKEVGYGIFNGMILLIIFWILFIGFKFLFLDDFYSFFTVNEEVFNYGMDYMGILSMFSIFFFYQIFGEKIMQGIGYMKIAMFSQLTSAILNIILDPILIYGQYGFPELGVKGAAIATVFSQFVGVIFILPFVYKNKELLGLGNHSMKLDKNTMGSIFAVGLPIMLVNSFTAIMQVFMNFILSEINEIGVSIIGIYIRLQSIITMPVFGLSQGFMPLIGYNYGAKNFERIKHLYRYAIILSGTYVSLGVLIFELFPDVLYSFFTDNTNIISEGILAMRIMAIGVLAFGIYYMNIVYMQGLGVGIYGLIITIVRQFVIVIPLAFILSKWGLNYVWFAFPVSEFVAMILAFYFYNKVKKEKILDVIGGII